MTKNPKIRVFVPADFYGADEGYYEMSKTTYDKIKRVVSKINEDNYDDKSGRKVLTDDGWKERDETLYDYTLEFLSEILKNEAVFIEENHKYTLAIVPEQVQLFEGRKAVAGYCRG